MNFSKIMEGVFSWVRDAVEVAVTVAVLVVVLRLVLNSQTLVPLVVVTSSSMVHGSSQWSDWLVAHNFTESEIGEYSFQRGFHRGDMIVTKSPGRYLYFGETGVGDIVIYDRDLAHLHSTGSREPIIHRVIGIVDIVDDELEGVSGTADCYSKDKLGRHIKVLADCRAGGECPYDRFPKESTYRLYITKGDNNAGTDQCGFSGGIALPVTDPQLKARGWIRLPYIGYIKLVFNSLLKLILFVVTLGRVSPF